MTKLYFLLLTFIYSCALNAAELANKTIIKIPISKECKSAFYGPPIALVGGTKFKRPKYELWDSSIPKAMSYKDVRTSVMLYVERDGRHIAGTVLPFKAARCFESQYLNV
jgi:hypothetical protein